MSKVVELSNGASKDNRKDEKIFCGVCGQRYHLPRILPCLHTFCTECISNMETYPANDDEDSSCDTDNAADWPISNGSAYSSHNLLGSCDNIIRPPDGFESPGIYQRSRSRGHSRHAQLIERRMQRSKSYTEGGFTKISFEDEQQVQRIPSKGCLKRNISSSNDIHLNARTPTLRGSSSRSIDFIDGDSRTSSRYSVERKRIILCPKCLKEVRVSNSLEELPRNFMVERFVAHDAVLSCSTTILICDSCCDNDSDNSDNDKSSSRNVTARCVECQENLCTFCEFSHRRQKKTKHHQLILVEFSNSNLNKNTNSDSGSNSSSMCTIPESVDETLTPTSGRQTSSQRPKLLKNITRLKLPNLQQFGTLLWKDTSKENLLNGNGLDSHAVPNQHGKFMEKDGDVLGETLEMKDGNGRSKSLDFVIGGRLMKDRSGAMTGQARKLMVDRSRPMSCLKHPEEELKMFCITCEESVCRDCLVLLHREHICQMVSKELFQDQMDDVDKLIKTVIPKVEAVDDHLASLAELKVKVTERSEKVKGEINAFMDTFVEAIEKHRNQLLTQVTSLAESKDRMLTVSQLHLQHMRNDVEQTCRFVAELLLGASDMEILSMKKLVTQRLRSLQDIANEPQMKLNGFLRFCPTEKGEIINNFQMFGRVVARKPSASKSYIEGDGLSTARISHKCILVLTVCDADGIPYNGSDVAIKAWIIYQEQSLKTIPLTLLHLKDGAYQLEFTPLYKGTHFLHVAVNGQSVRDSPFKFNVKTRWRRHQGVWQCCTFCTTNGRKDVACGCGGTMKGGYLGCGHAHPGHPGGPHWSCCGKMSHNSECGSGNSRSSPLRQVTL